MMEEPIDLAQKAAEKGNPWFGLGNLLTGNIAESASGTLTLADIEALQERMFDNEMQAGTTTTSAESPPVTVESLEAIFKQFPPRDVPLPHVDFANIFNHTFTPEIPRSVPTDSMFNELRWWGTDQRGRIDTEEEQRGVLPLADIQALQERMFNMVQGSPDYMVLSPYQAANWERWERRVRHSAPRERSKRHRVERWKKIRKRQRRAAQRRHERGEA